MEGVPTLLHAIFTGSVVLKKLLHSTKTELGVALCDVRDCDARVQKQIKSDTGELISRQSEHVDYAYRRSHAQR